LGWEEVRGVLPAVLEDFLDLDDGRVVTGSKSEEVEDFATDGNVSWRIEIRLVKRCGSQFCRTN